jgi:urease accessory protein
MRRSIALREAPGWYTPPGLPDEVIAFDDALRDALEVGASGKVGLLELALTRHGGVTRVQRHYQRAPLHVFRPIYLDDGRPDMAFVYVQQSGDGVVQGDRYRVDIDCGPSSATHVTTQAATNVYGARQSFASQLVHLRVGAEAVLEYLPDAVVPFRGSRLFQRTRVTAHPTATVILGETLLPGRVARGEIHAYDLYWSETEVRSSDDVLLFADVLRLSARRRGDPRSLGVLGDNDVIAALYVVSAQAEPAELVALMRTALAAHPEVLAGASELPNRCGAAVKLLGPTSKAVRAALMSAWNTARLELLGVPAPNLRKG